MAFLAYRFVPAGAARGGWSRGARCAALGPDGWRAGLVMGVFLTAGYIFQTLGLEHTSASNAGFITGPVRGADAAVRAAALPDPGRRRSAWAAAGVSALGLFLLSGAGGEHIAARRRPGVPVRVRVRDPHPGHGAGRAALRRRRAGGSPAQLLRRGLPRRRRRSPGDLEAPRGATVWSALLVTSLVASALGFIVQSYAQRTISSARTALILAAEPAFAGLFGYLLQDDRLSAAGWLGAGADPGRDRCGGRGPAPAAAAAAAGGLTDVDGSRQRHLGNPTPWSNLWWAGMPVTRRRGVDLPDRYEVTRLIGVGGMAAIWAAEDGLLRRAVAIKVLAEQFAEQPQFVSASSARRVRPRRCPAIRTS